MIRRARPGAPQVQDRKHRRLHDREQRHRLGEAVDGRAPALLEQQQDRGDERPGMADPDPPNEVDDRVGPGDRDVVAPQADACPERPDNQARQERGQQRRDRHDRVERARLARPDRRQQLVGDLRVAGIADEDRNGGRRHHASSSLGSSTRSR
jgi:hypothetical protein